MKIFGAYHRLTLEIDLISWELIPIWYHTKDPTHTQRWEFTWLFFSLTKNRFTTND